MSSAKRILVSILILIVSISVNADQSICVEKTAELAHSPRSQLEDLFSNDKIIERFSNSQDPYWQRIVQDVSSLSPNSTMSFREKDSKRKISFTIKSDKSNSVTIKISYFKLAGIRLRGRPKGLSLELIRFFVSVVHGLQRRADSGFKTSRVVIEGSYVVNKALVSTLKGLGFQRAPFIAVLRHPVFLTGAVFFTIGVLESHFTGVGAAVEHFGFYITLIGAWAQFNSWRSTVRLEH